MTAYYAHPTAVIDAPCEIGAGTKVWHFCHVMSGARIGRGCSLGQNVFVAGGVVIGDNVKIQNNVSVYEGVTLEDDVFCGPSMVFTNIKNPRSQVVRKGQYLPTLVRRGGERLLFDCGEGTQRQLLRSVGLPDIDAVFVTHHHADHWLGLPGMLKSFDLRDRQAPLDVFGPPGTARLVKAGSVFVFQMHYTTNGEATTDKTSVGIVFAKNPPQKSVQTGLAANNNFVIPPGEANHEVRSSTTFGEDVKLLSFMPHMHFRGKDFKYTATYPDGRTEVLLNVPKYDFNWQLTYTLKEPVSLPKGTRLDCVAYFDNSSKNKYNPDPTKPVRWGDQTWEEMMIGWFTYTRASQAESAASTGQ